LATRKYDNGPNGWTDYNDKGEAVGAGTYNAPGTARNPFNADPSSGGGGMNSGEGSLWSNATGQKVSSGGSSLTKTQVQPTAQDTYQKQLADYQAQIATQAAKAKQDALRQAWESNQQGLNSQKSTVGNNYQSAANKLNAVRDARLPEFQQQSNAASADATQTAMRLKEIMAATGRGDSGYSRSNQLNVDLNRSNALQGIASDKNAFTTDVGNQLSDVDAQRVAALNDIASKLQLGQRQYSDGTLSLTNALESEKASGALRAFLEATTRADQLSQQSLDNSYRQSQADQASKLSQLQQEWQQKQFAADQEAQQFNQSLQQGQITGQYNGTSTLAAQAQAAEQAYKNAALAQDQSQFSAKLASDNSNAAANRANKSITQSSAQGRTNQDDASISVDDQLGRGVSPGNIANSIESQRSALTKQGINVDALIKSVWAKAGLSTKPEQEDAWR
jgi:hypothetical protein